MSEEEFRKITKEYAEMYFTKGIDSTKIFKYVDELEKKVEQLENIRKDAIEYINNHQLVFRLSSKKQIENWFDEFYKDLLNILNKGSDKK